MKIIVIILAVLILIHILIWNVVRRIMKYKVYDYYSNQSVGEKIEKFNKKASIHRNFNISMWIIIIVATMTTFMLINRITQIHQHQPLEIQSYINMSLKDYNK